MFLGVGPGTRIERAARGAEGCGEKAKHDKRGTKARENAVIAGAHLLIVRGVGGRGCCFLREESRWIVVAGMCPIFWAKNGF